MDRKLVFGFGFDSELGLGVLAKDAGGDSFGAAFVLDFKGFVGGDKVEGVEEVVLEGLAWEEESFLLAFFLAPFIFWK